MTVIDLSLSPDYRKGHIPGAWFAIRARLAQALAKIALQRHARADLRGRRARRPRRRGSARADQKAGALAQRRQRRLGSRRASRSRPTRKMADEPLDVWLKPYERAGDPKAAMNEYLSWEIDLLARIERDGTTNFMTAT